MKWFHKHKWKLDESFYNVDENGFTHTYKVIAKKFYECNICHKKKEELVVEKKFYGRYPCDENKLINVVTELENKGFKLNVLI